MNSGERSRGSPGQHYFYDYVAPFYDAVVGPVFGPARRRAVAALGLRADSHLLILGIGTGLDLVYLPGEAHVTGVDLSGGMLRRARRRADALRMSGVELHRMDAQSLDFPDASFDAAYLPLIVAVASDGARVLSEAARVVKPGSRIAVLDKFWPEGSVRPPAVRALSELAGTFVTHLDRRFSEIHAGTPHLRVLTDEPALFGGYFRLIALEKPARLHETS